MLLRKYKIVISKHLLEMWLRKDFKGKLQAVAFASPSTSFKAVGFFVAVFFVFFVCFFLVEFALN